jgi:hypothetical protein
VPCRTRLRGCAIAEPCVQTLTIVEDLEVVKHGGSCLLASTKAGLVDVLLLQRGEEALHRRVIQAIPAAAHGLGDAVSLSKLERLYDCLVMNRYQDPRGDRGGGIAAQGIHIVPRAMVRGHTVRPCSESRPRRTALHETMMFAQLHRTKAAPATSQTCGRRRCRPAVPS